ncbi:Phosphatidylethanolamine-binding protein PEBP [Kalmanozyma brasiliensis GHG001]|uniref:PEBP-like protein n=1 Tax=Kalmanozyma brasiliensis (strain GHG001) TaxID=1365824 RepID=V5EJJ7_KALBG|nr:Phosphatidylethanolamine-binding protein PEBP [Kalmanozyma brasiliensis GHG001]EST04925.1 Phosphatidylethanolamine-binding protein PEBP [Kalmanozyma brasiliensis GHG001]
MATSATRTACRSLLRTQRRSLSHSARASSSSSSSNPTWQPLLQPGVLPAYDEALAYLSSHASDLRTRITSLDTDTSLSTSDRAALKDSLEIAARINDPSTLAAFQSSSPTHYDASNPAFRHLRERVWRRDSGVLTKVMERCTLMHVLPDVLAGLTPTVDVQVAFGTGSGFTDHEAKGGDVLVGAFVEPSATVQAPRVEVNVFHEESKRYTLAILDPDQPDEDVGGFKTTLLALKEDVQLSATSDPTVDLTKDMEVNWIPPHPQQGTPYHRYTTVLFEQPTPASKGEVDRENFNLRTFAQERGLTPAGIHFWRAKWSQESADTISGIYRDVLKRQEPKYAKPPSEDKVRKLVGDGGSKWYS